MVARNNTSPHKTKELNECLRHDTDKQAIASESTYSRVEEHTGVMWTILLSGCDAKTLSYFLMYYTIKCSKTKYKWTHVR